MEENKQEKATEIDVRLAFERLFKPIEALQKLAIAEANRLSEDGIDTNRFEVEISPNMISLRIGDVVLYHELRVYVYDYTPNRG